MVFTRHTNSGAVQRQKGLLIPLGVSLSFEGAKGTSATPAESAAISTGVSRSSEPRMIRSLPKGRLSCRARLI